MPMAVFLAIGMGEISYRHGNLGKSAFLSQNSKSRFLKDVEDSKTYVGAKGY